jgi:hypothetical protein
LKNHLENDIYSNTSCNIHSFLLVILYAPLPVVKICVMKLKKSPLTGITHRTVQMAIIFLMAFILYACDSGNDSKLTVGKNGSITYIEIPAQSDQVTRFAATELQKYFEKITGVKLKIQESGSDNEKHKAIRLIPDKNEELVWDGYKITAGNNGVTIKAKEPRGILFGAYQLLEEAGCSFVYPGTQEEVVPRLKTASFIWGERLFNPVIEHRGLTPYGLQASSLELGRDFIDWMAKNKLNYILISEDRRSDCPDSAHSSIWQEVGHELLAELQKRGFIIEMAEHTIDIFFPRSLHEQHPEWFALIRGQRRVGDENDPYTGQMCYSNKEAVEFYAAAVAEYVAQHPEYHIIGTWPRDGGQWCECQNCQNDANGLFHAIKHVAERVKDVNPDMMVEYMIYPKPKGFQPPPEKLPENMSFLWIPDNGVLDSLGRLWSRKSNLEAQGTYQFEYLMGDNYRSRTNVWLNPSLAVDNARHAQNMEFRGVTSLFLPLENWWRAAFNNWFFAKACWDTDLNINDLLKDYCTKYYGKAARETEAVFHRIFNEMQADQSIMIYSGSTDNAEKYAATIAVAENITEQLNSIISKTQEPLVAERLSRLKAYVEYFRLYYQGLSTREKGSLARLADYSKNNREYHMVLMSPEYIMWRNGGLLK